MADGQKGKKPEQERGLGPVFCILFRYSGGLEVTEPLAKVVAHDHYTTHTAHLNALDA